MSKHLIKVTQTYLVRREITVEVEAAGIDEAIDRQMESEAPAFDDPNWKSDWRLQHEQVNVAPALASVPPLALPAAVGESEDDEPFHDDERSNRSLNF